jgi:hypothetical protein
MNVRRLLAVSLLALLSAAPARAEFSPEERTSAANAFEAARYFSWAEYWTGSALVAARGDAARAAIGDLVWNLSRAERGVAQTPHALAGWYGNPANRSREEQLAQFRFQLARTLADTLPGVLASLRKAQQLPDQGTAYRDALASVDQLLRQEVEPRLRKVDPSLPYLDPAPVGHVVPPSVGPHGDYYRAVRHSNDGTNYAGDTVDEGWLPFYRALRTNRVRWSRYLGDLYRGRAYGLVQQYAAAEATLGYAPEPAADRFCEVLSGARQLTNAREGGDGESVAETLVTLTMAWGKLALAVAEETNGATRVTLAAAVERGNIRIADWWGNGVDGHSWSLFRFENEPQKSRCR